MSELSFVPSGRGGRKALSYGISIGNHYFLTVHLGYFSICPKNLNVHVVNNFHPGFFSIFVTKNHVTKCPCHQKFLSPYVYVTKYTCHQKCVTICTVTKWLSPYVLEPIIIIIPEKNAGKFCTKTPQLKYRNSWNLNMLHNSINDISYT